MEKSELIKILASPSKKVMENKKIIPSIIIAESLRILFSDDMSTCYEDLILGNNPMAVEANSDFKGEKIYNEKLKVMYRTYDTIEEGIANYITLNSKSKFNSIKEVYNYKDALNKLSAMFYKSELEKFILAYKLFDIDHNVLKKTYSGKKNIIDSIKTNNTVDELKKITKSFTGSELGKTYEQFQKETIKEKTRIDNEKKNNKIRTNTLTKASMVKIHNANLYSDIYTSSPTRSISGTYYLLDGLCKNNRYAIVMKKEYAGKRDYIMGYVDKKFI